MDYFLFVGFSTTTILFVMVPGPSVAFASAQAVKRTASRWMNVDVLSGTGLLDVGVAMVIKGYREIPSN